MTAGEAVSLDVLPAVAIALRPLVNRVAAIRASVHTKLLAGFLGVAALLLLLAGLSLAVQRHMVDRVNEIDLAQERLDRLRQMQYLITSQSHDRTMALFTHAERYNGLIAEAKAEFLTHLDALELITPPDVRGVLTRIGDANERFNASGERVLGLYQQGQDAEALRVHLEEEHPLSHDIENPVALLLNQAEQQMRSSQADFASDQRLLTGLFVGFSVLSLMAAALLGFVFSWSFLLPLGRIGGALASMAAGQFHQRVQLVNRDEFGVLASNLNTTSQDLADMYGQLQSLNARLQGTNIELLDRLRAQVEELALSRGLITEAEERLRRDLAEVLHSRVQTRLLVVWYRLEQVLKEDLPRNDPAATRAVLAEIREQIDDIREQDVRQLSHRLHPSIIRTGLGPALEVLVDEMAPLNITLDIGEEVAALDQPPDNAIPEVVRLTAYRVVEEALANVVKHAGATRAEIRLRLVGAGLQL